MLKEFKKWPILLLLTLIVSGCQPQKAIEQNAENNSEAIIEEFLLNGCIKYNDGCNTCSVSAAMSLCTKMACMQYTQPECYKYN